MPKPIVTENATPGRSLAPPPSTERGYFGKSKQDNYNKAMRDLIQVDTLLKEAEKALNAYVEVSKPERSKQVKFSSDVAKAETKLKEAIERYNVVSQKVAEAIRSGTVNDSKLFKKVREVSDNSLKFVESLRKHAPTIAQSYDRPMPT